MVRRSTSRCTSGCALVTWEIEKGTGSWADRVDIARHVTSFVFIALKSYFLFVQTCHGRVRRGEIRGGSECQQDGINDMLVEGWGPKRMKPWGALSMRKAMTISS